MYSIFALIQIPDKIYYGYLVISKFPILISADWQSNFHSKVENHRGN